MIDTFDWDPVIGKKARSCFPPSVLFLSLRRRIRCFARINSTQQWRSRRRRLFWSSLNFSSARRNQGRGRGLEKVAIASGRTLAWDLRLPGKPLKEPTLTKNAHSPVLFQSGAAFYLAHATVLRCRGPSLSGWTTFTISRSTKGMKRGILTFLRIYHPASVLRKETVLW